LAKSFVAKLSENERKHFLETNIEDIEILNIDKHLLVLWKKSLNSINFLKHADRDSDSLLDLDKIDNVSRIVESCNYFGNLGFNFSDEMRLFNVYCRTLPSNLINLEGHRDSYLISKLSEMDDSQRRRFCLNLLEDETIEL